MFRITLVICFGLIIGLIGSGSTLIAKDADKAKDAQLAESAKSDIAFPKDYATTFTNYLSLDRTQNDDQIIRLFANDIAMKGLKETGKFPEGSILVGEVYKAKKDKDGEVLESDLGRRIKNKFAVVAVMEKRKGFGKGLPSDIKTGDWGFAAFKPDGSVAKKNLAKCHQCHAPFGETQHVFSIEHLK